MANTGDIQHTLKTGADEVLYLTPISSGKLDAGAKLANVIKARMTGESIQGSIETLESNELKGGRTPSKKKLGNESSEGSLDFEFSPDTFDALLASAFRNSWASWSGDDDGSAKKIKSQWTDGTSFNTYVEGGVEKPLFGTNGIFPDLDADDYNISELKVGTSVKEFDILRKLGGELNEDLWQRYQKMGVNTFDINVAINSIVTGSFGFMGINSPKRLDTANVKTDAIQGYGGAEFTAASTSNEDTPAAITKTNFVDKLAAVESTKTDQFVSTCGNLWINGQNVTWSENVSISLNNNLERKNAIMVKKAIATTANKLDITGNYQSYVVKGKSEAVYNAAVDNSTVEIMFILQDKEVDPENMYLFQMKHVSFDAPSSNNNGTDVFEDNLGYTSFDEDPVRILKISKVSA